MRGLATPSSSIHNKLPNLHMFPAVDPLSNVDSVAAAPRLFELRGKPEWVLGKVATEVSKIHQRLARDVVVACLGLAVKANADGVELVKLTVALSTANGIVLPVDHQQSKSVDRATLIGKNIIDTRGAWE